MELSWATGTVAVPGGLTQLPVSGGENSKFNIPECNKVSSPTHISHPPTVGMTSNDALRAVGVVPTATHKMSLTWSGHIALAHKFVGGPGRSPFHAGTLTASLGTAAPPCWDACHAAAGSGCRAAVGRASCRFGPASEGDGDLKRDAVVRKALATEGVLLAVDVFGADEQQPVDPPHHVGQSVLAIFQLVGVVDAER